jgi:type I restriction enzyme S subunit
MKVYSYYKDSGVEWIGEIPEHWDISKYKFAINIISGFPFKSELFSKEKGFPLIRIRDISSGSIETFYDGDYSEDYIIKKDDLVVGMDGDFNIRWWNNVNALLNQRCCSIKSIEGTSNLRFLYYVIPNDLKIINDLAYYTTVKHLSNNDLYNRNLVLPPVEEQTSIALYLDYKTNLIDATIEKKKRLIELLKEKRQAVINEAVTKGLNPNAPMKDSGVEWLGEIPQHWDIKKVKLLSSVISKGTTPSTEGRVLADEGIRYIKAENIKDTQVSFFPEFFIDTETHEILKRSQLEENDILFVIAGATIGKVAILPKEMTPANTNQAVCFIRLKQNENHKFLHFWLQSSKIYEQIWLNAVQSAQPNLSMEELGNFIVPYPSLVEKTEIVNFIDITISKIDDLIVKNKVQIEKLQTYRQSLISEAVTGKIDVRDWQPNKN